MPKNKFRTLPQFTVKMTGSGSASQIIAELKDLVAIYEKDRAIPIGEIQGPALLVQIEPQQ